MSWFSLRYWSLYRQKIVKVRPSNWNPNIFFQLPLQVLMFLFISCLKAWKLEKYYHMLSGCKTIHKPGQRFSVFWPIFIELSGFQYRTCSFNIRLALCHGNFSNDNANLENVYHKTACNCTQTQDHLVCKRTLNHLAKLAICSCHVTYAFQSESTLYSFAKWLSVHLQTDWFWVRVQLQLLKVNLLLQINSWVSAPAGRR